jgi:hypothetical protein
MAKFEEIFEDIGRTLDRELERLRQAAKTEVPPDMRRKAANVLRRASESFARFAKDLHPDATSKPE